MLPRINRLPKDIIPLSPPYITLEEEGVISRVLRSGTLSLGPYLERFEKKVAKFVGTKFAVATSSGTSGLHLSLYISGIKPGDEVITSPFSFVASANVILYLGAKPVFVDINPETLNIDPLKIESAITKNTKAILPVHIFGYSFDYDALLPIANKYKLKVVEDACESLGAKYKNKFVGNFGNLTVFAFYPNKQITTGEGGMIVTNDKTQYLLLKSLVNQGRSGTGQWLTHDKLGFNYRMDEMSAALGYVQMKKIEMILDSRRKVATLYKKYLEDVEEIIMPAEDNQVYKRSWWVFPVVFSKNIDRDKIMKILITKKVQCKPYLPSIHLQPYYRKVFGYKEGMFPVSESISRSSLALPLFVGMEVRQIVYVCEELKKAIKSVRKKR